MRARESSIDHVSKNRRRQGRRHQHFRFACMSLVYQWRCEEPMTMYYLWRGCQLIVDYFPWWERRDGWRVGCVVEIWKACAHSRLGDDHDDGVVCNIPMNNARRYRYWLWSPWPLIHYWTLTFPHFMLYAHHTTTFLIVIILRHSHHTLWFTHTYKIITSMP